MTVEQLDLESWQMARASDPATSHAAAKRVLPKAGTVRARVLWLFQYRAWRNRFTDEQLIAEYRGAVDRELWKPATESSIRTRRRELVDQGWLRDAGFTVTNAYGNEMTVWEVAP